MTARATKRTGKRPTKRAAIEAALAALPNAPTVFTTGYAARLAPDRPNCLPLTGSMGLALPVGIGVASATGKTTLVLDGDGSILMNPAALLTLGATPGLPVLHVVLDDGAYASTGGQPSPGERVDLPGLARASGLPAFEAEDADQLAALLGALAEEHRAACFIVRVLPDATPPAPRVTTPLPTLAARFTGAVARGSAPQN